MPTLGGAAVDDAAAAGFGLGATGIRGGGGAAVGVYGPTGAGAMCYQRRAVRPSVSLDLLYTLDMLVRRFGVCRLIGVTGDTAPAAD